MKRISFGSLVKQVSQASDFYGKENVSPEEFFRYKKSPFLAKVLVGVKCSNELFSAITEGLSNQITNISIAFDLTSIEKLDEIRKRIYKFSYYFASALVLIILAILAYNWFDIGEKPSTGSIVGYLFFVFWFGLITIGIFVQPIISKITDWRLAKYQLFKDTTSILSAKFIEYQKGLEYWQNLSWQDFEREVTRKFVEFGYNAVNTKFSGDEGVDVIIRNGNKKFIVQCKAMKAKIGTPFVRDFIGTIAMQGASGGMIISLNDFSNNSLEISNYEHLYLMKIQDFLLLDKYQLRKIVGW
ncbi:restriction endonuclease [Candidatus Microgenomates bacterium]|nr:restriction endonuclease [Candidatus Microgenomates bacterium]